jgi:DNA-binding transcriptional LysR family regulator
VPGPRWLEQHRGDAQDAMMCDNTEVAATVVAAGAGIGVLPCPVAELHGEMVRIFPERVASATGWLVYHESAREKPCVRSAVDLLCELFDAHRSLFSGLPA